MDESRRTQYSIFLARRAGDRDDPGHDVYGLRFERLPAQVLADLDQLCGKSTPATDGAR